MLLKSIITIALAGSLFWLYKDHSILPMMGVILTTLGLIWSLFSKKDSNKADSTTSMKINSGKNSVNNQSTGTINQTINHGTKTK